MSEKFSLNKFDFPKKEKVQPPKKTFLLKGCNITWIKSDEPVHGSAQGRSIMIVGKNKEDLAWTLAHELAHVLEPKEKYPPTVKKTISKDSEARRYELKAYPQGHVELDDVSSGQHSFYGRHYYPLMSKEEYQASRRSKRYLKWACGCLKISLEKVLLAEPPAYLKRWWDRGYFYQWRVQMEEKRKISDKKLLKKESAKAKFKRQAPPFDAD